MSNVDFPSKNDLDVGRPSQNPIVGIGEERSRRRWRRSRGTRVWLRGGDTRPGYRSSKNMAKGWQLRRRCYSFTFFVLDQHFSLGCASLFAVMYQILGGGASATQTRGVEEHVGLSSSAIKRIFTSLISDWVKPAVPVCSFLFDVTRPSFRRVWVTKPKDSLRSTWLGNPLEPGHVQTARLLCVSHQFIKSLRRSYDRNRCQISDRQTDFHKLAINCAIIDSKGEKPIVMCLIEVDRLRE